MPPANPDPRARALTAGEVATRLGVSRETVCGWIAAGELRALNVSRSKAAKRPTWRITQAALDAFEASRTAAPPAPAPRHRRTKRGDVIEFYT